MMARSGPAVGKSELLDGPCGPLGTISKIIVFVTIPPNNHFSAILAKHDFPYVDFRLSMKIIENH